MIASDTLYAFPASAGQQRLWWLEQAAPGSARYIVANALQLDGPLDVVALRAAFEAVVQRHEALRTTFREQSGTLQQIVHEEGAADFTLHEMAGDDVTARRTAALEQAQADARRPFDLTTLPLTRIRVLRVTPTEHLLVLVLHHIACDAGSMALVMRDLATSYAAVIAGGAPDLPPLPLQFADYAVWEQDHRSSGTLQSHAERWEAMLAGAPTRLLLPADRPRVAEESAGAVARLALAADDTRALHEAARALGVTPFMLTAAAFGLVLCRWTGQSEVLVATPVMNRPQRELEDVVGFFVNTVPLRICPEPALTIREWVSRVRDTVVTALEHADVPFERIVEVARPDRERGVMPLCQALVVLQRVDPVRALGEARCTAVPVESGTAKFDVSLMVEERAAEWTLVLEYRTDLFEPATADQLVRQSAAALRALAAGGDRRVRDLDLLGAIDQQVITGAWNDTTTPYPRAAAVHDLIAAQADRAPERVAVRDGARTLTYGELEAQAGHIAAGLVAAGAGPGARIGTLVEAGADAIALWLAILRIGATYVPFDVGEASSRLSAMLEIAGVRWLATSRAVEEWPASVTVRPIASLMTSAPPPPSVAVAGDAPAYVMFTSGSTGRPKGVAISHRAISRLVLGTRYVSVGPGDVVAHAANVAFDAATFEIWGALIAGATVAVVSREALMSPARLEAAQRELGLTVMFLTTAVFNLVARERPSALAGFRYLLFGGEAADPAAVSRVWHEGRPAHLVNVYGPTECTTFATAYEITAPPKGAKDVPIGGPIGHTTAYVCDDRVRLVPAGVVGELYLGGDGVALEYVGDAALTASKFVPDPFGAAGGRLYRTGDLVRWRHDGTLAFVGRTDDQVKIRGFRVEPGEVTRAILAHPAVREAAVIAVREPQGTRALRGAIVFRDAGMDRIDAVQAFLASRLPPFMRPSVLQPVDALPLTPNGKVDRRRLESLLVAAAPTPRAIVAPRDALEATLVTLWEELLGASPVGTTDDFFALGGHSLLAAEMLERAERLVGRRVALATLLEHPTVAALSDALFDAEYGTAAPAFVPIRPTGRRPPLFFFHGDLNGGGFYTRALARELDPDQPLIVIPPIGIDGRPVPPSIEQLAAAHADALVASYPEGPYAIAGYCHGGLLAFEMARCLTTRGHRVAFVGIVHANARNARLAGVDTALKRLQRLCAWSDGQRVAAMLRIQAFVAAFRQSSSRGARAAFVWNKIPRLFGRGPAAMEAADPADGAGALRGRHAPALYSTYLKLVAAYVPRRWDGNVSLFLPQEAFAPGDSAGWAQVAPTLDVHRVPGGHRTCITTHVGALGRELDLALGRLHDARCAAQGNPAATT